MYVWLRVSQSVAACCLAVAGRIQRRDKRRVGLIEAEKVNGRTAFGRRRRSGVVPDSRFSDIMVAAGPDAEGRWPSPCRPAFVVCLASVVVVCE